MTSTKLIITAQGIAQPTHPAARPGYADRCPIIEITGTEGLRPGIVARTYARCVILPMMHAEIPIPWAAIKDARQGQIIRIAA